MNNENILRSAGAGTVNRRTPAHIPTAMPVQVSSTSSKVPAPTSKVLDSSPSFNVPKLSNSDYSALVQSLAPLVISRDQANLIQALLNYVPHSIDDEAERQSSLREFILHL